MSTYKNLLSEKQFLSVALRARALSRNGTNLYAIAYKDSTLYFKTKSASDPNLIYTQRIQLVDVTPEAILSCKSFQDVERLIKDGNIKVDCNCPADLYWGYKYIRWHKGCGIESEHRRPVVRNPFQKGYVCFVSGTRVLTANGYVPIEDLKVGDLVFTHKGRLRPVLATSSHLADSTVRVRYGSTEIVSTPNHPYLACPRIGKSCPSTKRFDPTQVTWTSAESLEEGGFLVAPRLTLDHSTEVPLDEAFIAGLYAGDGHMNCVPSTSTNCKASNRKYRVKGLYIALDSKYQDQYLTMLYSLGVSYSYKEQEGEHGVTGILSVYDAKHWQRCLDSVNFTNSTLGESKHSDILHWSEAAQKEYIRGFFLADGTIVNGGGKKGSNSVYCTIFNTNQQMMEQLLIVCKQWFDVKLCWYDRKDFEEYGHTVQCKRMYYIRFTGAQCKDFITMMGPDIIACKSGGNKEFRTTNFKLDTYEVSDTKITPKIIKSVHSEGPAIVHNIQVADDESYIVEDVAVHNCKHLYLVLQVFPYIAKPLASKFRNWTVNKYVDDKPKTSNYFGKYKVSSGSQEPGTDELTLDSGEGQS